MAAISGAMHHFAARCWAEDESGPYFREKIVPGGTKSMKKKAKKKKK
jgi:hypothetical protein